MKEIIGYLYTETNYNCSKIKIDKGKMSCEV